MSICAGLVQTVLVEGNKDKDSNSPEVEKLHLWVWPCSRKFYFLFNLGSLYNFYIIICEEKEIRIVFFSLSFN